MQMLKNLCSYHTVNSILASSCLLKKMPCDIALNFFPTARFNTSLFFPFSTD